MRSSCRRRPTCCSPPGRLPCGWGLCYWLSRGRLHPGWAAAQCSQRLDPSLRLALRGALVVLQLLRIVGPGRLCCVGRVPLHHLGGRCDTQRCRSQPGGSGVHGNLPLAWHFYFLGAAELGFLHRALAGAAAKVQVSSVASHTAFARARLTAKLVEVNLVLGIVKLALIVLAMVFSAIPLPFEADMTWYFALCMVGW